MYLLLCWFVLLLWCHNNKTVYSFIRNDASGSSVHVHQSTSINSEQWTTVWLKGENTWHHSSWVSQLKLVNYWPIIINNKHFIKEWCKSFDLPRTWKTVPINPYLLFRGVITGECSSLCVHLCTDCAVLPSRHHIMKSLEDALWTVPDR